MSFLNAISGIFQLSDNHAAAWGFAVSFALCVLLVITKRWHGALTMDFTDGIQKFHTAPTPRVGGIPIVLAVGVAWSMAMAEVQAMLLPILVAGMPAFLFGLVEDITKGVGVMQRLLATMASGILAWAITGYAVTHVNVWGLDWLLAVRMFWAGLVVLGLLGFKAVPDALLRPLENRYATPAQEAVSQHVGLIVLGGAMEHPGVYQAHGQVPLGDAAERMTVPVGLMRQHPRLQLVFSGGEGRLIATGVSEAELAKAFYEEQGADMGRVSLEGASRTTRENARQVAALLGERCQQPWLLVTSAWHMPRAMAEFEAVGCQVTAYPVDFRTGTATDWTEYSLAHSLLRWQTALHEWLGWWVYRVTRS